MTPEFFDSIPILAVYAGTVFFLWLAFEAGSHAGKFLYIRNDKPMEKSQGLMVGGVLGMLTFVLAFTFSMAASRLDDRKQGVIEEVNAISTAWLRADFLEQPGRDEVRRLLRDYVSIRIKAIAENDIGNGIMQSEQIHTLLWDQVLQAQKQREGPAFSLFTQSINQVFDMHEKRKDAGIRNRIPATIWYALMAISVLTMVTVGTQAGMEKDRRLFQVILPLLAFAALTSLVVDLDRPTERAATGISQSATIELLEKMSL